MENTEHSCITFPSPLEKFKMRQAKIQQIREQKYPQPPDPLSTPQTASFSSETSHPAEHRKTKIFHSLQELPCEE